MNRLLIFITALSCATASPALAEQYWIAYEGNDFPENEGWTRESGAGGADRWIEDGVLVLDGLQDILIYDSYSMSRSVDPGVDELFIMRWKLKVDEVLGIEDPTVGVFSNESWAVGFYFAEDHLRSAFGQSEHVDFEAGVYHAFELRSSDMRTYELWMDGSPAVTGEFADVITESRVTWGDGVYGAASLSRWDYFEFGVIPEPSTVLGISVVAITVLVFVRNRKL